MIEAIHEEVRLHPRHGYKRIHDELRQKGWKHGVHRTERLYFQEGFAVKPRRRHRRGKGKSLASTVKQPATRPNEVWSWDFLHDVDERGRTIRFLHLIDEFTREQLLLDPRRRYPSRLARHAFKGVMLERGVPEKLRSDNGSEFTAAELQEMLKAHGVEPLWIKPGSPWENGVCEGNNARVRDEFLEMNEFADIHDASAKSAAYRHEWNHHRCHSGIGRMPPAEFARRWSASQASAMPARTSPIPPPSPSGEGAPRKPRINSPGH